ncbi:MAG: hypothetical protein NC115_05190 [Bacteroidales bacterium]|nr:hypothetical protein [Bacteroidales bacterium]
MGRKKKIRKVLLIEPNYSNKYPPVGLMKLATYYRNLGNWEVVFYKGDLKEFVIDRIADKCVSALNEIDSEINWKYRKDSIYEYIRTRKKIAYDEIRVDDSAMSILASAKIIESKDYYWKGTWKLNPEWDRVGITTLFTFYWDITIETINFAKYLVKDIKNLMVGGVLASIQPKEIEAATGIKPHVGILNKPGQLDKGDTQIIDELPLDYSILDEIEYQYPMRNAFYGYLTRGCIRKCPFCAVPTLEPVYNPYIQISERVNAVRELYGDQRDMLLMDNNVLASDNFEEIVKDLIRAGFGKGAMYEEPNHIEIAARNLRNGINDRAYTRKLQSLLRDLCGKVKGEDSYAIYRAMKDNYVDKLTTATKENLLLTYEQLKDIVLKYHRPKKVRRTLDFNQGVDARLFTEENTKLLASLAIKPLRIAFDDLRTLEKYDSAIRMSAKAGIKDFSNYLLYNFNDHPIDLYKRLRINVELCEELNINVYSFPMKYHPIRMNSNDSEDFSHNRNYIGKLWNRKYIRAIQAILNSTKGKVGRGKSFFYEAFGESEDQYMMLLEMPETFIIYRFFFKWLDEIGEKGTKHWEACWKRCKETLPDDEWKSVEQLIHQNKINEETVLSCNNDDARELLSYYVNFRDDIITPGTHLYSLKQEFDRK